MPVPEPEPNPNTNPNPSHSAKQVASALGGLSNFADYTKPPSLERSRFVPGELRPLRPGLAPGFEGFPRAHGRGCGTRNYLVLLCVSSRANAFARQLEKRLADATAVKLSGKR